MQDLFIYMMQYYGLREIPGPEHQQIIVNMFDEMGFPGITDDETAWCGVSLGYGCKQMGYEYPRNCIHARDWLKVGRVILKPKFADIVIFWRGNPNSEWGHVGQYVVERNNLIYTFGGNQGNEYNITGMPVNQVIGHRRLKKIDDIPN